MISSVLVAYGLSRFRIPFEKAILASLIAAIIVPRFVTIVPSYAVYQRLGWVGTWLPLIVPHFFANAYNVFLLRQFFMTIPRELDEAAEIDGAGPFRTLITIIVPQAIAAVAAVAAPDPGRRDDHDGDSNRRVRPRPAVLHARHRPQGRTEVGMGAA